MLDTDIRIDIRLTRAEIIFEYNAIDCIGAKSVFVLNNYVVLSIILFTSLQPILSKATHFWNKRFKEKLLQLLIR